MKLIIVGLFVLPFLLSFVYGLYSGRAWVRPRRSGGRRRRTRWVDRHRQPVWFWGAMVAYLAAAGCIVFFAFAV